MKRSKNYIQLIAVDLNDWMKKVEESPPPITGFSTSRLEYIIHLVLSHKQRKHRGSWSVLYMKYVEKIIPKAGEYFKFMMDEGIIEWKNYSAGRNSRLYRLIDEGKTEFRTITDQNLIRRIQAARKSLSAQNSRKYPHLNRWLYQVKIDHDGAMETIEETFQRLSLEDISSAEARRSYDLAAVSRIESGEIYIKVNSTNNRLDSNITNLPKELLKHISINGQPLIEMDISNSQPFFSICLFNPTPEIDNVIKKFLDRDYPMVAKILYLADNEDVKRYRSLVLSGKFYEHMMKRFTAAGISFKDRKEAKEKVFIVFFGKLNAHRWDGAAKVFKKEFPTVYQAFTLIKTKNYNRLAILLQRIEAFVILDKVAEKINEELPELPFLTRHDSILPFKQTFYTINRPEMTERVRKIMVDTIAEVTGNIPQGRMKRFI